MILHKPYKNKSRKGLFPYSNLIKCGICGCALTAEIKKDKYIYYHCSGSKDNCKQVYLKQEDIEQAFEELLGSLYISDQAHEIIMQGLRSSLEDKIEYHNSLVTQTEKQIKFLQNRIDQAYLDKIDRKISEEFWQSHIHRWGGEKDRLKVRLVAIQKADKNYLENANLIIELAKKALPLFQKQNATQKRRLVDILVSNCTYKDETLDIELKSVFGEVMKTAKTGNWCARWDSNLRPTD